MVRLWAVVFCAAILLTLCQAVADETTTDLFPRAPWTTSRISGSPRPPLPYVSERAFPSLTFANCLDIEALPEGDRLIVVEQSGKIFSFPNRPGIEQADLVADLAKAIPGVQQTYSIAFHPEFAQNRYCYVCCIREAGLDDGTQVIRFVMNDTDPPTIDVSSSTTIITWLSGGHNGCTLKFGLDGYLYISTGDGAGPNPPDTRKTGQDITDLLSSILRIDIDHPKNGMNYSIPDDNPFVDQPGARGEVWAYGLRNPWRMSVDRKTGDLWVGDVGWELWEMLNRVESGANYGWAVTEGPASSNPEWERGPTSIVQPTIAHPHSESSSITDGLTYYGSRLAELHGTHIYADYDTGRFWGFRFDKGKVVEHRELADSTLRVADFGEDQQGKMYFVDHAAGTLHRLVNNPIEDRSAEFPRTLSDSGLFESLEDLTPASGVLSYSINAEPWADHAVAQRHVAVPNSNSITPTAAAWTFPEDSVLVKTLSLDIIQGDPASRRRIETQILHFDGNNWNPYTYRWNDTQTDAHLVSDTGREQVFKITDAAVTGGFRKQTWRFAGRAECQRCHNPWSGPPLGFNTAQLNVDPDSSSGQLETYANIGLIAGPIPTDNRPRIADPHDANAGIDERARAYLHTNCAHCHRMHGGGAVLSHMQYELPLDDTRMLNARPSQGTFGIHSARVIAPGDPFRSLLFYRISKLGGGRMPRLGSTEVDLPGVALIHDWLSQLTDETTDGTDSTNTGQIRAAQFSHVDQLVAADQTQQQSTAIDHLLSSTSGALVLLRTVDRDDLSDAVKDLAVARGTAHKDASVRELFERFLPAESRVRRLGSVVQAEQILSLAGDAESGHQLFLKDSGFACRNCHRIGDDGKQIGPDLTKIAQTLSREQLLESILQPSKQVKKEYVTWLAETTQGLLVTGLLVSKTDESVKLKNAQNQVQTIPMSEIEELVPRQQSMMPDLLYRDMTAQQVADLVAYLESLR